MGSVSPQYMTHLGFFKNVKNVVYRYPVLEIWVL